MTSLEPFSETFKANSFSIIIFRSQTVFVWCNCIYHWGLTSLG
uniref:Uncharacterized protein n=1 Tax=Anguilla anguilla TaxID=7936 RepID=A0A0E9PIE4_ANGAN